MLCTSVMSAKCVSISYDANKNIPPLRKRKAISEKFSISRIILVDNIHTLGTTRYIIVNLSSSGRIQYLRYCRRKLLSCFLIFVCKVCICVTRKDKCS
jgi:hypothetical protein